MFLDSAKRYAERFFFWSQEKIPKVPSRFRAARTASFFFAVTMMRATLPSYLHLLELRASSFPATWNRGAVLNLRVCVCAALRNCLRPGEYSKIQQSQPFSHCNYFHFSWFIHSNPVYSSIFRISKSGPPYPGRNFCNKLAPV